MIRRLKESNTLKNYEIADILIANGFGNEEEGFLDYYLEDNPKYVASVNLEDMGAYVDDLDEGEHIPLPFANGSDRKILKTEYDVNEFLDFIHELNYSDMFESYKRNRRMTEEIVDISDDEDIDDDNYTNEEKDAIIDGKRLRHYLLDDNYYAWDAWSFNRIIDALLNMDKKHREFYRSGKKKNRASERRLHQLSMHVDALIQDADREAGNPVRAIDYSEIFDEFPELEQDAKRIGLKTK